MSSGRSDDTRARRATLGVEGTTCGSCVRTIERALAGVPGVERAVVDLSAGRAFIEGSARPDEMLAAVEAGGNRARVLPEGRQHGGCC